MNELLEIEKIKQLKAKLEKASAEVKASLERQIAATTSQIPPHPPTIPSIRNDFENRTAIHVLRRGVWELPREL